MIFSINADGTLVPRNAQEVLVRSDADLELLTDLEPGSLAYTVGYANMWQKGEDGNWVAVGDGVVVPSDEAVAE